LIGTGTLPNASSIAPLRLAPSYSCAPRRSAVFLSFLGRRAEDLAEVAKSNELDLVPAPRRPNQEPTIKLRDYQRFGGSRTQRNSFVSERWTEHYHLGAGYEGYRKIPGTPLSIRKQLSCRRQISMPSLHWGTRMQYPAEKPKRRRSFERCSKNQKNTYVSPVPGRNRIRRTWRERSSIPIPEKAYLEKSLDIPGLSKQTYGSTIFRPEHRAFKTWCVASGIRLVS